jgi:Flp pilus assembly protein TadD
MADAALSQASGRAAPAPWTPRERWILAGLLALACTLRVVHVLASQASPLFDAPQMDALYHVEWARAFAAGERFQPPPFFRAPLYPWLLGSELWLFGGGLLVPRLVQALLGASATLFVYLCARRAFGPRAAWIAGLLWASNWVGIFFDGELLLETLAVPLYLLGLWLALDLADQPRARRAFAVGAVFGLSAITRPNVLLFMPLLALWLFLRARSRRGRPILATALLAAGALLPILPITLYNWVAGRDFVLIASQAGVNLWIGNNPASDGSSAVVPGTREDWWGGYRDAVAQAERAEGRTLLPSEVSRHFARRALEFMRSQPLAWLRLLVHKARLFTWNCELGNNEEPRFLFERFSPLAPLTSFGFAWLFALGILGLAVSWRGAWERLPLWGFLATYSASIVVYFVNARFRLPVLPCLAIYAGAALAWIVDAARDRRWPKLLVALATALGLALFSLDVPPSIAQRSRSNGHLMLGTAAAQAGQWTEAVAELRRAVEISPANAQGWRALGAALRQLADVRGAEAALRKALEQRQGDADALDALADLLIGQGRDEEARQIALELARAEPGSARAPFAEGRAWFKHDLERARERFGAALALDPNHFGSAYWLGLCELGLGHAELAASTFERAYSMPRSPEQRASGLDVWRLGVEAWLAAGEPARARGLFDRGLAEFGSDPRADELRRRLGL